MKHMLMVASVPSMIGQFNMDNINILLDLGYKVDVACDFTDLSVWDKEKITSLKRKLDKLKIEMYQIDFSRSVKKVNRHFKAYGQLIKLLKEKEYNFVHCHSPIGGAITRLACKKTNTKCIYTAHGFHFYKGASKLNWLIYYPIEKICSCFTDVIITINNEDYELAKRKMKSRVVEYIPGVGVDIQYYRSSIKSKKDKRNELGIPKDSLLLLSVGELNKNKNHEVIIRALANINNSNIHYCIAGKGELMNYLQELSKSLNIDKNIHLLGFRTDIAELQEIADVFCFPSLREGLGLAAIEAMASGNVLITSNIHGINDYSLNGYSGYSCNPRCVNEFESAIINILEDEKARYNMKKYNYDQVNRFDIKEVNSRMIKIYKQQ